MKIILSRKGFDSKAGGYPSAHFVDTGRLLTLPIPEDNDNRIKTGRTYADLRFNDNFTYLDIMKQLGMKGFEGRNVHLDPDINYSVLGKRHPNWRGLFGQSGGDQSHLRNREVEPGDLFLFFGWFRDVIKNESGYKFVPRTDRHIIWGYMQIGEIEHINPSRYCDRWKYDHPHYFYRNRINNTAYIACNNLSFATQLPGYGIFNFNKQLVLTDPNQSNRSKWKLPVYFHPDNGAIMSYHDNPDKF